MYKRSNVAKIGGVFNIEVYDKYGNLKIKKNFNNSWTNEGMSWLMNRSFKSIKASDLSYYIGLINSSGTITASDVMASHSGWTENINYDEITRPAWNQDDPVESGGVISAVNSTKRSFTINVDSQSVYGAFLSSDNSKSGTSGKLLAEGALDSQIDLNDDDVIKIGYDLRLQAN
jgi:hypothetical protein